MVRKAIFAVVAAIPVAVSIIGKYAPHFFMRLPFPLSVILWDATGNEMPPYIMMDAWKEDEIDTWTKDGDLVVATGVKSGTTFMLYCTHQIRTKGTDTNDELFPDVNIVTPWMELRQSRAGSWAEQKDRYNTTVLGDGRKLKDIWDHPSYPFRIFKSHSGPADLLVRRTKGKKLKYIAMARNGLDVASSLTSFFSSLTEEFRNVFGGFPPNIPEAFSEDKSHPIIDMLLPGGNLGDFYFGYVKSWWEHRHDSNVLLLHYADVRKNLKQYVAKIAKFLEVDLNKNELNKVTERCSIEHMRKLKDRFNYKMPLSTDEGIWDRDKDIVVQKGKLVGKGEIGVGYQKFSDAIIEKWRKTEEEQFGHDPELLKWAREGSGGVRVFTAP